MKLLAVPRSLSDRRSSGLLLRSGWQGGSILVQTVLVLSLLVGVLVGTELGYLFYLKREMQKAVDLAAVAGAQALSSGDCGNAKSAALAIGILNLPAGLPLAASDVSCGRWDPAMYAAPTYFSGSEPVDQRLNAISITMRRSPSLLMPVLPGNQARPIEVSAVAVRRQPRAALSIRSTVVTVSTARATQLNAVLGGMLGGALALDAVGYDGLMNTKLQLLGYLDQLAVTMGIAAGRYDEVLSTPVRVGTLLQAAATALARQGNTTQLTLDALDAIRMAALVPATRPLVTLGSMLKVQTDTPAAALSLDLQVFQFVEGLVQLANAKNGLVAQLPLAIPGLINLTVDSQVIEPAQLSAVGDPNLARLDPLGPNAIAVRTAQIRTLVTVELPLLTGVAALTKALGDALGPLLFTLDSVLGLNLGQVTACLVECSNRPVQDARFLSPNVRIDISLDAGGGTSRVTDFSCLRTDSTSLTARTTTSAATLRIGALGDTVAQARAQAFSSRTAPSVAPLPLLDIGARICTKILLGLGGADCGPRIAFYGGGLALAGDVSVGATTVSQVLVQPPDVRSEPSYLSVSSTNVIDTIDATLRSSSALLKPIAATGAAAGSAPSTLGALTRVLREVIDALATVTSRVVAPLIDPLINTVVQGVLGLNLAQTEVGGHLGCTDGAELVF
jgi:uncharacterized membrane protein